MKNDSVGIRNAPGVAISSSYSLDKLAENLIRDGPEDLETAKDHAYPDAIFRKTKAQFITYLQEIEAAKILQAESNEINGEE